MSDNLQPKPRLHGWMLASLAVNIMLISFVVGRITVTPPKPPLPATAMVSYASGEQCEHGWEEEDEMAPPPYHGAHDDMPPPPPFFGPHDIFSREEMEHERENMHAHFEQMDAMRTAFAHVMEQRAVTKQEVLDHFAEVDKIMDGLRISTQDKVADKIAKMNDTERKEFAQKLLRHHP